MPTVRFKSTGEKLILTYESVLTLNLIDEVVSVFLGCIFYGHFPVRRPLHPVDSWCYAGGLYGRCPVLYHPQMGTP